MRFILKINDIDYDLTDDIIGEPTLSESYDEIESEVKITDVRLKLSNLEKKYDFLIQNLERAELRIYIEGKTVFRGYLDTRFNTIDYDVNDYTIHMSFISNEKKFWTKCENLSVKNLKERKPTGWFGYIPISPLFYSIGAIAQKISQLTDFEVNPNKWGEILLGNTDSIARFDNLDDSITVKDLLLELAKFYGFVIVYNPDLNRIEFIDRNGVDKKHIKVNNTDVKNFRIGYGGNFYDFVKIENLAWIAAKPEVSEQFFSSSGLFQGTPYRYIVVEKDVHGLTSKRSEILEVVTFLDPHQGGEDLKVNIVLRLPQTRDSVVKRIIYRSAPFDIKNFQAGVFYKIAEVNGSKEEFFTDSIEDDMRGEAYDEYSSEGVFFYFDEDGNLNSTDDNLEGLGYKVYNFKIDLKFTVGMKSYSDFGLVLRMLEPFGVNLFTIFERLRYLFNKFYVYEVELSGVYDVNVLDIIDVSDLNIIHDLKNTEVFGKVVEMSKSFETTELKIIVNKYTIKAVDI